METKVHDTRQQAIDKKRSAAEKRQLLADTMPMTGYVRPAQAAAYMGIAVSTLWNYVAQRRIAQPTKLSVRTAVWSAEYIREITANGIPDATTDKGEAA